MENGNAVPSGPGSSSKAANSLNEGKEQDEWHPDSKMLWAEWPEFTSDRMGERSGL